MKKYQWTTHKLVQETKDVLTIYFNTEQQPFLYLPGQYLNLRCWIDGELVVRSYSFSSNPEEEFPSITVKRVEGGKLSNYLLDNALKIDLWDIDAPFGTFYLDEKVTNDFPIVLLAGGSGIAPLFSMLKSIGTTARTPLLIYANKSPEETIFLGELESRQNAGRLTTYYSFSLPEFKSTDRRHIAGRFSLEALCSIIEQESPLLNGAHYFICGPKELIDLYQEVLSNFKVKQDNIHIEFFNPIPNEQQSVESDGIIKDVLVNYLEDSYFNDELHTHKCTMLIEVEPGKSLLEAMQENSLKVPSSCRNGTCGVCWAIKMNGEVRMNNNQTLTEKDIEEGIILLCQSYPLDQEVTINLSK